MALDPVVTLSDDVVTLRPWSRDDAKFMAEAYADPAIRRYNGVLDRLGRPAPPLSIKDAEIVINEFALNWRLIALKQRAFLFHRYTVAQLVVFHNRHEAAHQHQAAAGRQF